MHVHEERQLFGKQGVLKYHLLPKQKKVLKQ